MTVRTVEANGLDSPTSRTAPPTGRSPSACTASPTPPTPGATCCGPGRGRLPRGGPVHAGLRPDGPARRWPLPDRGPGRATPTPSTRPWAAPARRSSSATTGGPSPPTGPSPTGPTAGAGRSPWPCPRRSPWPRRSSPTTSCAGAGTPSSSSRRWPRRPWRSTTYAFIDRLWADWSPGYDATWDLARVKESHRHPRAVGGGHRLLPRPLRPRGADPALAAEQAATLAPVPRATLYLHGLGDGCFGADALGARPRAPGPGVRDGDRPRRRPLPPPRAARRRARAHPGVRGPLRASSAEPRPGRAPQRANPSATRPSLTLRALAASSGQPAAERQVALGERPAPAARRPGGPGPGGPSRRRATGSGPRRPNRPTGPARPSRTWPRHSCGPAGNRRSRAPGRAVQGPEVEERLVEGPRAARRDEVVGHGLGLVRPQRAAGHRPGQQTRHVGVDDAGVGLEGEAQDGPRRVGPTPGRARRRVQVGRHLPAVARHQHLGRPVEVEGPAVVAEALPGPHHGRGPGRGARGGRSGRRPRTGRRGRPPGPPGSAGA